MIKTREQYLKEIYEMREQILKLYKVASPGSVDTITNELNDEINQAETRYFYPDVIHESFVRKLALSRRILNLEK